MTGEDNLASRFNDFFGKRGMRYDKSIAPDMMERLCGGLALLLLAAAALAVWKGRAQWGAIPMSVWVHLATLGIVLAITPLMMWRRRGDKMHHWLGWVWAVSMFVTALISLDIRLINRGGLSYIHILSAIVIIGVPVLLLAARRHDIARHRGQARGFVIGALLVAGFFTFPFNRLLGQWLFS